MEFHLPREALTLWRIYALVLTIWGLLMCGILAMLLPFELTAVLLVLLIVLSVFILFYYLPRLQESVHIVINDDAILYTRGVFFSQKYIMPLPRMIYVQQFNTPISAAMRLKNLRLRAARSQLTMFSLAYSDAEEILRVTGLAPDRKDGEK